MGGGGEGGRPRAVPIPSVPAVPTHAALAPESADDDDSLSVAGESPLLHFFTQVLLMPFRGTVFNEPWDSTVWDTLLDPGTPRLPPATAPKPEPPSGPQAEAEGGTSSSECGGGEGYGSVSAAATAFRQALKSRVKAKAPSPAPAPSPHEWRANNKHSPRPK